MKLLSNCDFWENITVASTWWLQAQHFVERQLNLKAICHRFCCKERAFPKWDESTPKVMNYLSQEKNTLKLTKIYLLPFKAVREIKLIMFQYKIIHRILPKNSLLLWKKLPRPPVPLSFWLSGPVTFVYKLHAHKIFLE